jgi:hypothetical protein
MAWQRPDLLIVSQTNRNIVSSLPAVKKDFSCA